MSTTIEFSLFEGDPLNRLFSALRIRGRRPGDLLRRITLLWYVTWLPMAILALLQGLSFGRIQTENFFCDIAAYIQFFIGLPLFIIAESFIGQHTREAAKRFSSHGLLDEGPASELSAVHLRMEYLRKLLLPDIVCAVVGLYLAIFTINYERIDTILSWHAIGPIGNQSFSIAGLWAMLVALPLLNYWWLRWVWKISLWCWYLKKISSAKLNLVASHPDRTGGLGFLSEVQSKFGLVILAYGVTNVLAAVSYKLLIEKADFSYMTVWFPIVSFVICAPLLFTIPLFLFTKQLYRTKKRALELYQERAMERAMAFERKWLAACETGQLDTMGGSDLSALNNLNSVYDRIHKMRVVPFDLRSISELIGSAIGPVLPLLPYWKILPDAVVKSIEQGLKILSKT